MKKYIVELTSEERSGLKDNIERPKSVACFCSTFKAPVVHADVASPGEIWAVRAMSKSVSEFIGVRLEENPLMNVGVVGLQEPRISVTLYTSKVRHYRSHEFL